MGQPRKMRVRGEAPAPAKEPPAGPEMRWLPRLGRAPGFQGTEGLGSEGSRRQEFRGQGSASEASAAVLPTGDFSTCRRQRSETAAGGRNGFPKSPFTSLIRVTLPLCAILGCQGSPFLGKGKVNLLQAAEGTALEPAPEKTGGTEAAVETQRGSGARPSFPLPASLLAWIPRGFSRGNAYAVPSARHPGLRARGPLIPKTSHSWGAHPAEEKPGVSPAQEREKARSSSPPPPEVSSFLQGRGWLARAAFSRGPNCEVNFPHRGPRPRACTHSYTLTLWRIHTLTRAQTHTLSDVLPRRRQRPRALFQLSDGRGARGGARAAEKLITDSADYCGSLC